MTMLYVILALVGIGVGIWYMMQKSEPPTIPMDQRGKVVAVSPPGDSVLDPRLAATAPALATFPHSMLDSSLLGL